MYGVVVVLPALLLAVKERFLVSQTRKLFLYTLSYFLLKSLTFGVREVYSLVAEHRVFVKPYFILFCTARHTLVSS